jgi:Ser/Thr protein kinase RdoA (MazF antagonist)
VPPLSPAARLVLDHLKSNSQQYFGQVAHVDPLREVIGPASHVVRARLHLDGREVMIYVKVYAPDSSDDRARFRRYVTTEFERTRLARKFATAAANVPVPLACLADHYALVTEEASGVTLARMLKQLCLARTPSGHGTVLCALHRVGRWLREFQAGVPPLGFDVADLRAYLDVRLTRLVSQGRRSFDEASRRAVLAFHDTHAARLTASDLRVVPIHADLCPSNILVRPDGITVLDLANSCDGARYCDVAHLYMHLAFADQRFRFGPRLLGQMQRHLLESVEPELTPEAPLFRLLLLQHLACYLAWVSTLPRYDRSALGEWRFRRVLARCWSLAGIGS